MDEEKVGVSSVEELGFEIGYLGVEGVGTRIYFNGGY